MTTIAHLARAEEARAVAAARRFPAQPMLGMVPHGAADAAGHGRLDDFSLAARRWNAIAVLVDRIEQDRLDRPGFIRIYPSAAPASAFVLEQLDRALRDGADDARLSALYAIDHYLVPHAARAGTVGARPIEERKAA